MAFALAKVTWLALAVIALGPLLLGRGTPAEGDAGIVHIYLMLALTFPAGIGVVGLLALYSYLVLEPSGHSLPTSLAYEQSVWFVLTCVGWAQWFWLAPRFIAAWRAPADRNSISDSCQLSRSDGDRPGRSDDNADE